MRTQSPISKARWEELHRRAERAYQAIQDLHSQLLLECMAVHDEDLDLSSSLLSAAESLPRPGGTLPAALTPYFYALQSEWCGNNPATGEGIFKLREPHIAKRICSARPEVI